MTINRPNDYLDGFMVKKEYDKKLEKMAKDLKPTKKVKPRQSNSGQN